MPYNRTWRGAWVWIAGLATLGLTAHGLRAGEDPQRRVEVVRDTWVSSVPQEANANNGGATRVKLKGTQEFAIVDINPRGLEGRVIRRATLHLRSASKDIARRVTVSSLSSDWAEGTGTGYAVQRGSAAFSAAEQGVRPWAFRGSDMTAVCNGIGSSVWGFADATPPDAEGWQTVAVAPAVVAARIAGLSRGFVVFDDVGSEYERDGEKFTYRPFLNRFFYSREEGRSRAPYFTVEMGEADREPPGAVEQIQASDEAMPPGEAIVSWITPADRGTAGTMGFQVRVGRGESMEWDRATAVATYLVPLAGAAGQRVRMHLRDMELPAGEAVTMGIRAVDGAGNVGPVRTAVVRMGKARETLRLAEGPAKDNPPGGDALPAVGGVQVAVIDGLDKVDPVRGTLIPARPASYLRANHLWSGAGKTIRLFAAKNEFMDFQVVLSGQSEGIGAELRFDEPGMRTQLFRFRHVKTPAGVLPDPLVPVEGPVSIPAADERIEGQKHATLLGEVYVPHNAKAGVHRGQLTLRNGAESLTLMVEMTVWDFTLPDKLSFLAEMNCYGLPDTPADVAYYRLAHAHRTTLNRLGYSWRGQVNAQAAPRWTGKDFDWRAWDAHYGPLLDGSAFADLPRGAVPVEAMYLQLNENWPVSIDAGFKGGYWADESLTPAYRKAFVEACAKTAAHLREKKWHDTFFEFYLNNKVYYKEGSWSRSSAPWILDEPANTQDYWALRYYGVAFHEGAAAERGEVKLAYRCDISRPQWQRNLLDGVLDVNVVGGELRRYQRMVMDRKRANGEVLINYGGSNRIEQSNVQPAAWCIDTWLLGGDGVLPWQTVGTDRSWREGDELSLFYPGAPAGKKEPVASVRLKAYRRGQQDVEYLTILAAMMKRERWEVAEAVRGVARFSPKFEQRGAEDAGIVDYATADAGALWALRVRVGATLSEMKPPAQRQWTELRTPARDMSKVPHVEPVRHGR